MLTRSEHTKKHYGWIKVKGNWRRLCSKCGNVKQVNGKNWYFNNRGYIVWGMCKKCTKKFISDYMKEWRKKRRYAKVRIIFCPNCDKKIVTTKFNKRFCCYECGEEFHRKKSMPNIKSLIREHKFYCNKRSGGKNAI